MPRHVQSSAGTIGSFKLLRKHSVLFEKKERKDSLAAWTAQIEREREREREREGKQRNTHSKPSIQMQSWREHKHIESHLHAEKVWRAQGVLQSFFLIGCLLGLASRVWWLWDWKAGQECLATSGTNSDKYPNKLLPLKLKRSDKGNERTSTENPTLTMIDND